jgi:hypothetical protein
MGGEAKLRRQAIARGESDPGIVGYKHVRGKRPLPGTARTRPVGCYFYPSSQMPRGNYIWRDVPIPRGAEVDTTPDVEAPGAAEGT